MQKIIVIVGPTASGKTALSIELARALGRLPAGRQGEVISADSRQVYRGLDVGSGKVTKKEMRGVPHHLLDVANPKKVYSASDFVRDGRAAISEIAARGKIPIIAGGTGFYIDALLGTIPLTDVPPNPALRKKLAKYSLKQLQTRLKKVDPKRFKTIDTNNPVRLVRAIEIAAALGKVPTTTGKKIYDAFFIGIGISHEKLKEKIRIRLFARIRGIEKEAKKLHTQGLSWKRMEELGLEYRYMARYLQKKISRDELMVELEKGIVKYAKRQMTWFKRNTGIVWLKPQDTKRAIRMSRQFLNT
ncbi:tRNA (adenosine(37)-N6)-dimethylallyltransferase MiaA [Patescibacteria group bacterium]|nr:tRNA (adenosine(37)-N6)-dimethylallyltransferase MiaA [Patescibacteria group bacterium]